jgi:hypothetical protein
VIGIARAALLVPEIGDAEVAGRRTGVLHAAIADKIFGVQS